MTFLNWATLGIVCALAIVALVVAAVLFIAWRPADGPLRSDDPTPFEEETDEGARAAAVVRLAELRDLAAERRRTMPDYPDDEPMVPVYIPPVSDPDAMTMFRGGAVHVRCVGPMIRTGAPPCAGCAVHLDHVLAGA